MLNMLKNGFVIELLPCCYRVASYLLVFEIKKKGTYLYDISMCSIDIT